MRLQIIDLYVILCVCDVGCHGTIKGEWKGKRK